MPGGTLPAISVLELLSVSLQPGRLEEALEELRVQLPISRSYDGCKGVTVHIDQDDPTQLLFVARWESREKYLAYAAWRKSQGGTRIRDMIAAPNVVRLFDDVDV